MRDLLREAKVPTSRRPLALLRLTVSQEKPELERLGQADELELSRRGPSTRCASWSIF